MTDQAQQSENDKPLRMASFRSSEGSPRITIALNRPTTEEEAWRLAKAIDAVIEQDRVNLYGCGKQWGHSGWRPIQEAPKGTSGDTVRILLVTAGDERSRHAGYCDAYYAAGGSGHRGGDGWVIDGAGEEYRLHHNGPTHWMPLPALP